jgi:hypothetical protein
LRKWKRNAATDGAADIDDGAVRELQVLDVHEIERVYQQAYFVDSTVCHRWSDPTWLCESRSFCARYAARRCRSAAAIEAVAAGPSMRVGIGGAPGFDAREAVGAGIRNWGCPPGATRM